MEKFDLFTNCKKSLKLDQMINFSTLEKCFWKYLYTQNEPKLPNRFNSALVLNEALGNFLEHENR